MHLWKVVSFYFHLVKETATGPSQVLPAFFLRCFSAFLTVCRHSLFIFQKVLVVIENTSFPKNLSLFRACSRHSSLCGTPFRPCAPHGRREFFHGLSSVASDECPPRTPPLPVPYSRQTPEPPSVTPDRKLPQGNQHLRSRCPRRSIHMKKPVPRTSHRQGRCQCFERIRQTMERIVSRPGHGEELP